MSKTIFTILLTFSISLASAQILMQVPYSHVLDNDELIQSLNTNNKQLLKIQHKYNNGNTEKALEELTAYFKETFSTSYFFNWKEFNQRFKEYNNLYKNRVTYHKNQANQHLELYPASTTWKLPFKNLKNNQVSNYQYRHLARQHKADDIAFLYHYTKDLKYLKYIPEQAKSINEAFNKGQVETIEDGNGAYEAYRGANRVYNWLFAHQCNLASENYTWQEQLTMIKTFLHTGAKLYHHNTKYHEGNHQTRGMSALAMLAIIFKDIYGTDLWLERSKSLLEDHLQKEIYPDNFQFERTVHYHIADIKNYAFPYQIAKINGIDLGNIWDVKIKGLFDAIVKLAMPNKKAPVLQDDTDSPWAEYNEIDNIMAYGAAMYGDSIYKHYASKKVSANDYWFLTSKQIKQFESLGKKQTKPGSTEFESTGYYIMNKDDLYMIISAGLTPKKPDHQHADMLGVQVYAYDNMMLPNYQVRYYLKDLDYFKNSWVKNVAIVDSIPQGQNWKGNKGGSGFGKYKKLPVPKVLNWSKNSEIDIFTGTHDGYKESSVNYIRKVFFIKDGFWVVKDEFSSLNEEKCFQQIWQGHYVEESEGVHYRSVFQNGAGLEIIQLGESVDKSQSKVFRGKGNLLLSSRKSKDFGFTTLLFPFKNFEHRIKKTDKIENIKLDNWIITKNQSEPMNVIIENKLKNQILLLNVSQYKSDNISLEVIGSKTDLYLQHEDNSWNITNYGTKDSKVIINKTTITLKPGQESELN